MGKKIEFENKVVEITDKDNWTFDEVQCGKLKELVPEKFEVIQKEVINYLDNEEKILAERKEKEDAERVKLQQQQIDTFKTEIETLYKDLLNGYKVTFRKPNQREYGSFDARYIRIEIDGIYGDAEVSYDNKVYSNNSWYPQTTSRCWVVTFDYKNTRYVSLESAIKKAIEKLEANKSEKLAKQNKENQQKFEENEMKNFAEENGFQFEKNWHRYQSKGFGSDGYYTYNMYKTFGGKKTTARISYNREKEQVEISSYTISKKDIKVEDLI